MPFAAGGIWKNWGDGRTTLSIITTPANELLTQIRHEVPRMLFIANNDIWDRWLNIHASVDEIKALFKPFKDGELEA